MEASRFDGEQTQILILRQAVLGGDGDAPRERCRRSVQFLIDEVRQPPNALPDQRRRPCRIQKEPGVQFILAQLVQKRSRAQQEPTKDVQAALPDPDDAGRVLQIRAIATQDCVQNIPETSPDDTGR